MLLVWTFAEHMRRTEMLCYIAHSEIHRYFQVHHMTRILTVREIHSDTNSIEHMYWQSTVVHSNLKKRKQQNKGEPLF